MRSMASSLGNLEARERVPDSRDRTVRPTRAEGSIRVDGLLDEPDRERAEPTSECRQREPVEGEPTMEGTVVRVLYDDENLYIGHGTRQSAGLCGK